MNHHHVKITSDGIGSGTEIFTADGKPIPDVTRVDWTISVDSSIARATIYCDAALDATAIDALFLPAPGTPLRDRARLAWKVLRGRP